MSKVDVGIKIRKKDFYLHSTEVENLFINEFMLAAPGEYVKLYIYGLMQAQYMESINIQEMANALNMLPSEIKEGLEYWAKSGMLLLKMNEADEIEEIEFVSLISKIFGASQKREKNVDINMPLEDENQTDEINRRMEQYFNDELRALYDQYEEVTGHTISQNEIRKLAEAIKVYNISMDVMSYAIQYCAELEKYSIEYMFKVALRWTKDGCRDVLQVRENLDRYSRRNEQYGIIFKEMGFTRFPTPADKEMINRWFDEMGFTIKEVIDACRTTVGQREPSLKYVNKVLENKQLEAGGINTRAMSGSIDAAKEPTLADKPETAKVSKRVLDEYYKHLRNESERVQNAHIDEVLNEVEEMRELIEQENNLNTELRSINLGNVDKDKRAELKEQRKRFEEDKLQLLIKNNYPEDYLDRKYQCVICGDTGTTNEGNNCSCKKARAEEAYKWYQTRTKENKN